MAFIVRLIEGSEPDIDLFYAADDNWSMLDKGFIPNDPESVELWGGRLEDQLVRQDWGPRELPLRLQGQFASVDALIDAVNALQERLIHAMRYRKDGWGDEVFLRAQPHSATFGVDYPVCSGWIDKTDYMNACHLLMDGTGHREAKSIDIGVTVKCEPYWEATETYTLSNSIDNPGFWRGAVAPGDSWTEVDPAGNLTLAWDTGTYEVMGRSVKWTLAPDAINNIGITSDNITVAASTTYYLEARGLHTAGCDRIAVGVWNVTGAAWINAALFAFDNQDGEWEKLGALFATPAGCVSINIVIYRWSGNSSPGNKTFYCDAFYLENRTDAPTGWCSGRNLVNHLDSDADHLNVLCVTEIPGEVEAEIKHTVTVANNTAEVRFTGRTRDAPWNYVWQLLGANATVTAGDGTCIDSALTADATAPGGSRVTVTFATSQALVKRCYWNLTSNLASYYGKFALILIAKMEGATDTARVAIYATDEANSQGVSPTELEVSGTSWKLYEGWEALCYRIGTRDNALIGAGNNWIIGLYASTDGAPTDDLHIAGAFLVPLDEGRMIGGRSGVVFTGGSSQIIIKEMDGDRGVFPYGTGTDTRHPNIGAVGTTPLLLPAIENYLYFITSSSNTYTLTDTYQISTQYRPRGIFLRGTNPG